jgi:hypothetical protein
MMQGASIVRVIVHDQGTVLMRRSREQRGHRGSECATTRTGTRPTARPGKCVSPARARPFRSKREFTSSATVFQHPARSRSALTMRACSRCALRSNSSSGITSAIVCSEVVVVRYSASTRELAPAIELGSPSRLNATRSSLDPESLESRARRMNDLENRLRAEMRAANTVPCWCERGARRSAEPCLLRGRRRRRDRARLRFRRAHGHERAERERSAKLNGTCAILEQKVVTASSGFRDNVTAFSFVDCMHRIELTKAHLIGRR